MRTNLPKAERRLQKLEQKSAQRRQHPDALRAWARDFEVPEDDFLWAAAGYARELREELGDASGITLQTLLWLRDIAQHAREHARTGETQTSAKKRAAPKSKATGVRPRKAA